MSKVGIVYAKEVPMIKVKQVKEINGKGTPLHTVIQYWTKDGILVAEGQMTQLDEPEINNATSCNARSASIKVTNALINCFNSFRP